jgi:hypothetical protein
LTEPWRASNLIIEKLHFRADHQPNVKQSVISGRLFSTLRSSTDTELLTLEELALALFSDSPNSVAFHYSPLFVEALYELFTNVNIKEIVDVVAVNNVEYDNILQLAKQLVYRCTLLRNIVLMEFRY